MTKVLMIIFKVSHRGFKYDYLLLYFLNWSESFALGLAMLCTIMSQNVVQTVWRVVMSVQFRATR